MRSELFGKEALYDNITRQCLCPAKHTHKFHFGAVEPYGVFSVMLLVLFTFNVTETENTTQQPFITKPWEIGGHASLSLPLSSLSLSISPIVSPFIHLSILLLSVLIHCLTFTQKLPLHNPPPLICLHFSAVIQLKVASPSQQMEEI